VSPRVREDSVHPRLQSGAIPRPLNFTVRRQMSRSLPASTVAIQRAAAVAIAAGLIAGGLTMWLTTTTGTLSPGGRPGIVPLLVALIAFFTAFFLPLRRLSIPRRRVGEAAFLGLLSMLVLAAVLSQLVGRLI
jgi:hypothetical protein